MNEDFFIDDILENLKPKKKKIDSKDKGGRGERDLCKVLAKRFPDTKGFFRVVGSGNRWSQVNLTEEAKKILTADIVTPENFRFSIECKYGYADIDLSTCFDKGNKDLDEFLIKTEKDANRVNKYPLLCWRKSHKPWICFFKEDGGQYISPSYKLHYRDWTCLSLNVFLSFPDDWFFIKSI